MLLCLGTGLGLFSLAKRVEAQQGQYGVCSRSDGAAGTVNIIYTLYLLNTL